MHKNITIIAEVKPISPSGFRSDRGWGDLLRLANDVGDIVSIHTDPRWGGSFELLKRARRMTDKPILAKGIHSDDIHISMALQAGADHVLVVGRVPQAHAELCFIEPLTLIGLANLPQGTKVVWNSRDLSDISKGNIKTETFEQAREIWNGWLCQASNIRTVDDIRDGADAVLVGTHLEEFARSLVR